VTRSATVPTARRRPLRATARTVLAAAAAAAVLAGCGGGYGGGDDGDDRSSARGTTDPPRAGGGPLRLPSSGARPTTATGGAATGAAAASIGPQEDPSPDLAAFLNLSAPKPVTWMRRPPENRMRAANWTVPAPSGGNSAEVVVFTGIGGSVDQNIERWEAQFRSDDGQAVAAERRERTIAGMPATIVELTGDYRGMNAWYTDDQTMLAAILEPRSGGSIQVRLVGDRDTVAGQRDAFMAFVEGIKVTGAPLPETAVTAPPAPVPPAPPLPEANEAGRASFAGYSAPIGADWVAMAPTNAMRAATWQVPGADGAADAEVVVFGGIGGSPQANIDRWVGQFRTAEGGPVEPRIQRKLVDEMPVTIVELRGTYSGMAGSGTDQIFLAAIVEPPAGMAPLQVRLVGDAATVEAHRAGFAAFVDGLRRGG